MPDTLSRGSIESQQGISEQVVADAVCAVKVRDRRACRNIDDATLSIESHATPVVRGACVSPRILRPGVIAEFPWMRNGVKRPANCSRMHVESANVPRRRG